MALLDFRSSLRTQCVDFRDISLSIDPEICFLSRDLPRDGHTSDPVIDPGCIPNGTGNHHQYDLLCLCPVLGAMGELPCLGLVDGERCLFRRDMFCTIVYHVRFDIGFIAGAIIMLIKTGRRVKERFCCRPRVQHGCFQSSLVLSHRHPARL